MKLVDGYQVPGAVPLSSQFGSQAQSSSFQTMSSLQVATAELSGSTAIPVTSPVVSPLPSLLGSYLQDEASHLLNYPKSSASLMSSSWPPKRVAVDPLLSSGASQGLYLGLNS
ncbi:hypothetical protein POM88_035091 [Heracleum sosnowskyi]|uniref:Uncharacterized protein n=1 Tax=Heracleum sosnowskyi TaxID=360622 RepID=A0AAD8HME1_9APIA|nr:hypothetical protein POM88_035091 [Heracleum sosnowskyi]